MKKSIKQTIIMGIAAVMTLGAAGAAGVYAGSAGSDQDPLVTLSYVEKRIQEVLTSVTAQVAELKKQSGSQTGSTGSTGSAASASVFQVIQVEKGSFVYFGGSTEFIVRSGKVTVIATANGGLSDLTDGKDIAMGQSVAANHHMLVPRDDGRGLNVLDTTFILVKGPYTITQ